MTTTSRAVCGNRISMFEIKSRYDGRTIFVANIGDAEGLTEGRRLGRAVVMACDAWVSLRDADLRYADLRDADLGGADLRGADLRGADLRGADLGGAYLRDADLRYADLRGAYLRGADLRGAYLRGADLGGAYLRGADLGGADLRGAYLRGADLRGAYLRGADLGGADLDGADLGGADLDGTCIYDHKLAAGESLVFLGYPNGWPAITYLTDKREQRVHVGCRDFTIAEGRAYWKGKGERREVLAALNYAKEIGRVRGWKKRRSKAA